MRLQTNVLFRFLLGTVLLLGAALWAGCDEQTPPASEPDAAMEAGAADGGVELGPDQGPADGAAGDGSDAAVEAGPDAAGEAGSDAASSEGGLPGDGAAEAAPDGPVTATAPVWLLHITDTHVGASSQASAALTAALKQVVQVISPSATIVTGDITDDGSATQFSSYQAIIKGQAPAYPAYFEIPGNHDLKSTAGTNFLAGTSAGKAGAGLYGMTYVNAGGAKLRVVRTNTADNTLATSRLLGFFSSSQKSKLLALPAPSFPLLAQTVVAGHHPIQGLFGLQVLGTDKQMSELLSKFKASVYLCGHVHSTHLSWIKNTLVVQAATLGKPSIVNPNAGYMIVGLDSTGPSVRSFAMGKGSTISLSWPQLLVTTPAHATLGGTNPWAKSVAQGSALAVRAVAFSPKGVTAVQARLGSSAWSNLSASGKHLWQSSITAPATAGKYTLEVRATSPEGADSHKVTLVVGP